MSATYSADFPWAEIGLAKKLGVSRERLRECREGLQEGRDWAVCGKSIQWSEKAAELAAAYVGAVPDGSASKKPVLDSPVNEETVLLENLTVSRRCMNPHAIAARLADGEELIVRVPHNDNFRPGMVIRAEKSVGIWILVGRCPRLPGRW